VEGYTKAAATLNVDEDYIPEGWEFCLFHGEEDKYSLWWDFDLGED
jgi:hypothetical protein